MILDVRYYKSGHNGEFMEPCNNLVTVDLPFVPRKGDIVPLADFASEAMMREFPMAEYFTDYNIMSGVLNWMTEGDQCVEVVRIVIRRRRTEIICIPVRL